MGVGNIVSGISSGTPGGYASAALNAAHMASNAGAFGSDTGSINSGLGAAGGLLSAYEGLSSGQPVGEAQGAIQAAAVGAHAAAAAGSSAASEVAPMLGGLATGIGALGAWYGLSQMLSTKGNNLDEYMNANDYKQMGSALAAGPGNTPQSQMAYYNAQAQLASEYTQTGGARMPFTADQLQQWGIPQMATAYMTYTPPANKKPGSGSIMGQGNTSGHQL